MNKQKQIKKYFKSFPKWTVWMIVAGVLFAYSTKGLGLVFTVIGILRIVALGKKPSDAQMDAWLEEDLKMLNERALSKTGTDPSELVGEAVTVTDPRFWDIAGAEVAFKKGKDNILRYSPVGVTVLNFTPNQLISYSSVLDLTTGNTLNEGTEEYFYQDVVSVSTKTKSKTVQFSSNGVAKGGLLSAFKGTTQLNAAETFELTMSGGTSIEIVLRDPELIKQMGGGDIPTNRAEKAIQVVRKMLRDKKIAGA